MKLRSPFRILPTVVAVLAGFIGVASTAIAGDGCPTDANWIATDRPDITNSSLVVPFNSIQVENGLDWTVRAGSNALDATNTRLRLGIAHCTELLFDPPSYFGTLDGL